MFVFDFHHAGQECRVMDVSCAAENLTQACRAWQEGCELLCESYSREEKDIADSALGMTLTIM